MNARRPAPNRRLRFPFVPLLISLGAVLVVFGGCALNTHGTGTGGGGTGAAATTCNVDKDCDDHEACTEDACGEDKICTHTARDDGPAPDSEQRLGDCKTVICADGVAKSQNDDADILDDGEDCTTDTCTSGVVHNTPKPPLTACDKEGHVGRCTMQGKCEVVCTQTSDCVPDTPCKTGECDTTQGICNFPPISDGTPTPGVAPAPGDCNVHVCIGGEDTAVPDDSDVPVTATDCDTHVCTNGVPSNPGIPIHTVCSTYNGSQPGFCDGNGTCQECAQDGDCTGPTDDCRHPACDMTTFKCFEFHDPVGTVTVNAPPQVAGDCQNIVCDGNGGTMLVHFNNDPADDNNVCTTDVCKATGTMSDHNPVTNGIVCGTGGTLSCVGGLCAGCTMNSQCPQATCTVSNTLVTFAQTCDGMGFCVAPTPTTKDCAPFLCTTAGGGGCTTTCSNDAGCAQTGVGNWCNGNTCTAKLPNGAACGVPANGNRCQSTFCVDGVCCNNACGGSCQACSATKKGSGMDGQCGAIANGTDPDGECPDDGIASCDRDGRCNGAGACRLYAAGSVCTAASCGGGTLTVQKTCDGNGTCVTPMPATVNCAPYLCSGMMCTTSCANDAGCSQAGTGNWCNGGVCVAKLPIGNMCTAGNQCQNPGACVDSYCCDAACNTSCKACSQALKGTGSNGQCGNAAVGAADPRNLCGSNPPCGNTGNCAANAACEVAGAAMTCSNQTCAVSTLTVYDHCNGSGTCTGNAMTSTCPNGLNCNGGGTACRTSCSTGSDCQSGYTCSGLACKFVNGAACTQNTDCASGVCGTTGTGFCCSGACSLGDPTCKATGCAMTTGACQYPTAGTACGTPSCNTSMDQLTVSACNGSGTCATGSPTACPGNLQCADTMSCYPGCGAAGAGAPECLSGFYCDGTGMGGAGACQTLKANGNTCGNDFECTNNKCSTRCCTTPCAAACNTGTDQFTSTASNCDSGGACVPAACPAFLRCQNSTVCETACGNANPSGDGKCISGYYCDGVAAGACQPKKASGATCGRPEECTSGSCSGTCG